MNVDQVNSGMVLHVLTVCLDVLNVRQPLIVMLVGLGFIIIHNKLLALLFVIVDNIMYYYLNFFKLNFF